MLSNLSRPRALALCALPVAALVAVAGFAPLPFAVAQPGTTADVLGEDEGKPVITITGAPVRPTKGQLRMTTILATGPSTEVGIGDVVDAWFRTDRSVLPHDLVYPSGQSDEEVEQHNLDQMKESQDAAALAALNYLGKSPKDVKVTLHLEDIGGPSAGLLFSLGIVDKLDGNGAGGDLTGGRVVAGTGTIKADGTVGAVGGVSLKTQAAGRDGATVFLVPKAECSDAEAELPKGIRLIPVSTLKDAVASLTALGKGQEAKVPSC
ncbi:S16 family serine protease [Streptomyces solicathayae]|uniref:S16 family serine protease n=1 Tax=Streptomyces solicathayae TaxID=3081768 RepID=A0ABZ0LY76_9ACTN|nr:S16 family serine protease [Streptomyces sp. HUAS YS2]WOX24111.1 S16 family serine protease [Streptomyces sp. HUAS YS2]